MVYMRFPNWPSEPKGRCPTCGECLDCKDRKVFQPSWYIGDTPNTDKYWSTHKTITNLTN